MTQTEQEIEKLKTLNDNYTELVDIFNHIVPREYVVLTLSAPSDVDWTMYSVVVTNNDKGTSDTYVIPINGVVEFEVKYDTTYTIKLPVLGDFIAPKDLTFTAGMKMREVGYSYRIDGVFGVDANGKHYSIEQIEALEDKSIIKYGGFTNTHLENSLKEDGSTGNGFLWLIDQEITTAQWASSNVEFSQELLPFLSDIVSNTKEYCDGETYTKYIIQERDRLAIETPAADICIKSTIVVGGVKKTGFMPAPYQSYLLYYQNKTMYEALYSAIGTNPLDIYKYHWNSMQENSNSAIQSSRDGVKYGDGGYCYPKTSKNIVFICYPL